MNSPASWWNKAAGFGLEQGTKHCIFFNANAEWTPLQLLKVQMHKHHHTLTHSYTYCTCHNEKRTGLNSAGEKLNKELNNSRGSQRVTPFATVLCYFRSLTVCPPEQTAAYGSSLSCLPCQYTLVWQEILSLPVHTVSPLIWSLFHLICLSVSPLLFSISSPLSLFISLLSSSSL